MNKRLLLNVGLLLLAIGLALAILVGGNKGATQELLFEVRDYDAQQILIERENKVAIALVKDEDIWMLRKPGAAPVNQDRIQHLLTILSEPVISEYDIAEADLEKFGLAPGKIKLTINNEEVTFGSTNDVTKNRYILKNNKVYTVAEIVYGTLGSSVTNLLSHRLIPEEATLLEVEAPAAIAVTTLASWKDLEAHDIADYDGDETILGILTLTLGDGVKQEWQVMATSPALILGREDLQVKYTLSEEASKKLMPGMTAAPAENNRQ